MGGGGRAALSRAPGIAPAIRRHHCNVLVGKRGWGKLDMDAVAGDSYDMPVLRSVAFRQLEHQMIAEFERDFGLNQGAAA